MLDENIKISFICPVLNEYERAPKELNKLINLLQLKGLLQTSEIIIVDNLSIDGTREWLLELEYDFLSVILNNRNLGKGGSTKKGILASKGEIGIVYDLDGEYLPEDYLEGATILEANKATMALGSRTRDGSAEYVYLQNYLGVRLITEIINFIYNKRLTDSATGLKTIDLQFYRNQRILFNGFNVDFELVCLALNKSKKIVEYNGKYFPRSISEGKKIKALRDGFSSLLAIIKTASRHENRKSILYNMFKYIFQKSAFRYFLIGSISTLVDTITFISIIKILEFNIIPTNFLAFVFSYLSNYLFGIDSVFTQGARFNKSKQSYLMLLTSLFGLAINTLLIFTLLGFTLDLITSKLLAIIPTFLWNYFIRRFYIYRKLN